MQIGKNISEVREAQKLSPESLAKELKITVEEYLAIEKDEIDLTLNKLESIASLLSMSATDLILLNEPTASIKNFFINQNGNQGVNIHIQGIDQQEIRKAYKELYAEELQRVPKLEKLLREHNIDF